MVGKRRSRGAVVMMDETVKVKVEYIGVALVLCDLWEARNRDRFWNEELECARRQIVQRQDMCWAFVNTLLMSLSPWVSLFLLCSG